MSNYQNLLNIFSFVFPEQDNSARSFEETASNVIPTLKLWAARIQQRKQLSMLNDAQLDDIGVTYAQVGEEIKKPFWIK